MNVERDGSSYRVGGPDEVAWITAGTSSGRTVTSAIPDLFAAYATLAHPDADDGGPTVPEDAVIEALQAATDEQPWWLGFLDTGGGQDEFDGAPRTTMYTGWSYVVVEAGPQEALRWRPRAWNTSRTLPDVMFPADRSWLLVRLWDDTWYSMGGPRVLVDALLADPRIGAREVSVGEDMTPPGHTMR